MRTLEADSRLEVGLVPSIYAPGLATGAAIDSRSARFALVLVSCNAAGSTGATTITVQHSADGVSGWTDVDGASLALDNATNLQQFGHVRLTGVDRFIRVQAVTTSANNTFGVNLVLYALANEQDLRADSLAFSV